MELVKVKKTDNIPGGDEFIRTKDEDFSLQVSENQNNPFIEANTKNISLSQLKNDCIIPVFSKDNEKTIAHQEFIEIAQECVQEIYPNENIGVPEIRVSHTIKGRTASAIYKPVKELLEHEKTQYFERMAFIIRIPSITENINGNHLALTVGGVRAYNQENLYNKKTYEKFKFFIGFQNMVCCNLCISTDGFSEEMKAKSFQELKTAMLNLIGNYNAQYQLDQMKFLTEHSLTEKQFAQLIGKTKLYSFLPKGLKNEMPELMLNDGQISTVAKDYYLDNSFCRGNDGNINLWNVYNLFTGANKSSYIDSFLSRNVNAFDFTKGLADTISGSSKYHWFLS